MGFGIPPKLKIVLEGFLLAYQPTKQRNKVCLKVLFTQEVTRLIPHWIENTHIAFIYMWPNQQYQSGKTPFPRNIHTPSCISITSDKTCIRLQPKGDDFKPEYIPLGYNNLSPALPGLSSVALTPDTTSMETHETWETVQQSVSQIQWDIQEIINRVRRGEDLDQPASGLTTSEKKSQNDKVFQTFTL